MKFSRTFFLATALCLAPLSVSAQPIVTGDLTLSSPWTRATPPNAKGAGAFIKITNSGQSEDKLISVESNVAKRTEVHEMKVVDGIMKMRPVENGIVIPEGQTLELKPGSYHVMFMGLKQPFKMGEEVQVQFNFEKAKPVTVNFPVEKIGAKAPSSMNHHSN
ncbi:copper chaperone PCu(A)C [Flexibacterium corallicola]|uniref:copper chaperone PCu(A)C n=1 Tax=Flexibacterium corallicola TaxID=3037259 RepID=UPI00286F9D4D|nr:copper chaperone PCu(A)C [Pseudovibrio sp. M1P-2-3]